MKLRVFVAAEELRPEGIITTAGLQEEGVTMRREIPPHLEGEDGGTELLLAWS